MSISRRALLAAAMAIPFLMQTPAFAATTIAVSLGDSPNMEMASGFMNGMGANMAMADMHIKVDTNEVPAGPVTFSVTNDSKDTIHEMIVAPLDTLDAVLPYDSNMQRVDEEAAESLGEVSELEPGQSGALTVNLNPVSTFFFATSQIITRPECGRS